MKQTGFLISALTMIMLAVLVTITYASQGVIEVASGSSEIAIATSVVTGLSIMANFVPRRSPNAFFNFLFRLIHLGAANVRIK
jgi:hypothetical protein